MTEKDKNYYRNLAKNNLLGLTAKDEQNRDVLFKFIAVYEEVKPKKVAAYISKSNEADTSMIIRFLWKRVLSKPIVCCFGTACFFRFCLPAGRLLWVRLFRLQNC